MLLLEVNEWMKEDQEGKWVQGLCASTQEGSSWKILKFFTGTYTSQQAVSDLFALVLRKGKL